MKKRMFRKLRELCNEFIGEKETNKIIEEAIKETIDEIKEKPKAKKKKSDGK